MPNMVTIEPNPDWEAPEKGVTAAKAEYEAVKARGALSVSFVSALEAIALSKGMYRIRPEASAAPQQIAAVPLDRMASEDLKRLFFSMGGKTPTGKQMKRSEIIAWIEKQTAEFEILDDDGGE